MADYNINLTTEEIDRRLTRGAVDKDQLFGLNNPDGLIPTIQELQSLLEEWVAKNYRIFNATTSFHVGTNWVELWNKLIDGSLTNETLNPNTQRRWTVTLIAAFPNDLLTENPHGQLRIASYIDKNIYSITFNYWNGQFEWGKVYKVAFEDEVEEKIKPIEDGNLPAIIKTDTTFKYDDGSDKTYLKVDGGSDQASGYNFLLGGKHQYGIHVDQLNGKTQPLLSVYDYKNDASLATIKNKAEITTEAKEAKKNISSMQILNADPDGNTELAEVVTDKNINHYVASNRSVPVNVLSLGIDNTGATGISDIINEHTQKYALYFPAGTYLIDKPLMIKNPIIGAISNTNYTASSNQNTRFITTIKESSLIQNIGNSNIIENIYIDCRCFQNDSHSVSEAPAVIWDKGQGRTKLRNITIDYLGTGSGIIIEHNDSVATTLENINIFSDYLLSANTGLYIVSGNDIRVNNIIINGCKYGIYCDDANQATIYGSDIHIWCGVWNGRLQAAGLTTDEDKINELKKWFPGTKGIRASHNSIILTNLFLDTVHIGLAEQGASYYSINNLIYGFDGSINGTGIIDCTLTNVINGQFFINGGYAKPNVNCCQSFFARLGPRNYNSIHNFMIYVPNTTKEKLDADGNVELNENGKPIYITDHEKTLTKEYLHILPQPKYGYSNKYVIGIMENDNSWEIARVPKHTATQGITITTSINTKQYINVNTGNNPSCTISGSPGDNGLDYYYKDTGDFIVIYAHTQKTSDSTGWGDNKNVWIETTECFINHDFTLCSNNTAPATSMAIGTTDLTKISWPEQQ